LDKLALLCGGERDFAELALPLELLFGALTSSKTNLYLAISLQAIPSSKHIPLA
jgi:hypothetical protein